MKTVVLVSGGFDPLHKGHIQYFTAAKQLGNYLVVGLNSDAWLRRKKGSEFLSIENRSSIVNALEMVDEVWEFSEKDDSNNNSSSMIDKALLAFPDCEIVFANGGDRNSTNIPELEIFKDNPRVKFVFSVGGSNKADSSSWILDKWKAPITERDWGFWKVIDDKKSHKVKELVIRPGCSLSNQRHYKRNEMWFVVSGALKMETDYYGNKETIFLEKGNTFLIKTHMWHKASNASRIDCRIIEVQFGEVCIEEDIERKDK